ncbi:MAG: hypothetical protein ACYCWW_06315 [Deltaproteobacteria bacterium]
MAEPLRAQLDLAERAARARRLLLLGREGPWFGRAAAVRLEPADATEHGVGPVRLVALLGHAAALDEALAGLARTAIPGTESERLGPMEALERLALEDDPEERAAMAEALARALRAPAQALGGVFARVVEAAGEAGAPAIVSEVEASAARALLAGSEDAARDVLSWSTFRLGRSRRQRLAWPDVLQALVNRPAERWLLPPGDPWLALRGWREAWGAPVGEQVSVESIGARVAWGAWAIRASGQPRIGVAAPAGALRWRFALQGLGRWDALREAGSRALLPVDPSGPELLAALWPLLLSERRFLDRVAGASAEASADEARRFGLSELLLGRLAAAGSLVRQAFEETGSLEAVREAAASRFREALFAPIPPELGMLCCAPWLPPLAEPRAFLSALALADRLREGFDEDWWRNPKAVAELRRLASESATRKLDELVPLPADRPLERWIDRRLGG